MSNSSNGQALGPRGLFANLYELTMLSAYDAGPMAKPRRSVFSFARCRVAATFLLACGLDDLLDELESFRFQSDDVAYLRSLRIFPESFCDELRSFRFTGDVFALAEGTRPWADEQKASLSVLKGKERSPDRVAATGAPRFGQASKPYPVVLSNRLRADQTRWARV